MIERERPVRVNWRWSTRDCYLIAQPAKPGMYSSNTSRVRFTGNANTPGIWFIYYTHAAINEVGMALAWRI